jgi:ubiquinone/menaquinone biosynthesis C-methylase UbiE
MMKNKDETERWANYRKANNFFPEVRRREIEMMLDYVQPRKGETILECGAGNGALTLPLAESVGLRGKVIAYDVIDDNLKCVNRRNKNKLPIVTKKQTDPYVLPEEDGSVDKVVSLASLHHYDNRAAHTGYSGRQQIIKEFARVLKRGGQLIVGDVERNTNTQRYFDAIDKPRYCHPNGHPHDFLNEYVANKLCDEAGLDVQEFDTYDVRWFFDKEDTEKFTGEFFNMLHNSKCSVKESYRLVRKHLEWNSCDDVIWPLFFMVAEKTGEQK